MNRPFPVLGLKRMIVIDDHGIIHTENHSAATNRVNGKHTLPLNRRVGNGKSRMLGILQPYSPSAGTCSSSRFHVR